MDKFNKWVVIVAIVLTVISALIVLIGTIMMADTLWIGTVGLLLASACWLYHLWILIDENEKVTEC